MDQPRPSSVTTSHDQPSSLSDRFHILVSALSDRSMHSVQTNSSTTVYAYAKFHYAYTVQCSLPLYVLSALIDH
jgi:hypothetical protein